MTKLECGDVVNAMANFAPLECRTVMDPLERDFLLTDVVFELYDHPNGDHSRACVHSYRSSDDVEADQRVSVSDGESHSTTEREASTEATIRSCFASSAVKMSAPKRPFKAVVTRTL